MSLIFWEINYIINDTWGLSEDSVPQIQVAYCFMTIFMRRGSIPHFQTWCNMHIRSLGPPHFWPFKDMYIYIWIIWYICLCSIVLCIYKYIHIPIHFAGQSLFRFHNASVKLKDKSNNNMKTSWPTSHGINTWQPPIT